jgi:GNAT superfamily N-acetyltransferase
MKIEAWKEAPIGREYDRESFDCGDEVLNLFLRLHARKSHELGGSKTFLAIESGDGRTILGFYTLSPASLAFERTPEKIRRGLERHDVPVFRLGRLAVDLRVQGQSLGGQLLFAAGRRCLLAAREVGGVALLIDAKDVRAAHWYSNHGAVPLLDAPLSLLLPLKTIEAALLRTGHRR